MNSTEADNQYGFETDFHYAIVAGWLILPALGVLFALFDHTFFLIKSLPVFFHKTIIMFFGESLLSVLFYLVVIYTWVKRKKIMPLLMIIILTIIVIQNIIISIITGELEWLYILSGIIWTLYFIRSKRVKATFVN